MSICKSEYSIHQPRIVYLQTPGQYSDCRTLFARLKLTYGQVGNERRKLGCVIEEINLVKSVVSQAFLSLISMADYAYPWAHPSYEMFKQCLLAR